MPHAKAGLEESHSVVTLEESLVSYTILPIENEGYLVVRQKLDLEV